MSTKHDIEYRRKWVKNYVERYKPVTVSEVAEKACSLAIPSLPVELDKTYWRIAKDLQLLRRTGQIEPGSVVYRKLD